MKNLFRNLSMNQDASNEFGCTQKNVDTLVEIKLEKHKNLWEESRFYWGEIEDGTLTFNRPQVEVWFGFLSVSLLYWILLVYFPLFISCVHWMNDKSPWHDTWSIVIIFHLQVAALRKVNKEELLDFVAQNISRKSPNRRKLSIQVYGGQHVAELEIAKGEAPQETTNGTIPEDTVRGDGLAEDGKSAPKAAANRIDNIYIFKRSQQLHESLRGGKHAAYAWGVWLVFVHTMNNFVEVLFWVESTGNDWPSSMRILLDITEWLLSFCCLGHTTQCKTWSSIRDLSFVWIFLPKSNFLGLG